MKKVFPVLCSLLLPFAVAGCHGASPDGSTDGSGIVKGENDKVLVAYFSRADENYGVGNVQKGNTQILAEMIAKETGATLFHIQRKTPYPADYDECTEEAQDEKGANARPALFETLDISGYEYVFIGYPIWWGDMPMPVYTFLESQNWSGKTVLPFVTHEGSGLSGTVNTLKTKCVGATVKDGLSMLGRTAQNSRDEAKLSLLSWMNGMGIDF